MMGKYLRHHFVCISNCIIQSFLATNQPLLLFKIPASADHHHCAVQQERTSDPKANPAAAASDKRNFAVECREMKW